MMDIVAHDVDQANKSFWNEMCGTVLAKQLGINDSSVASLAKFDKWYFDFYPYLYKYFNQLDLKGRSVLEIGLGYGTVSSYLASQAANYYGVDIAEEPVNMVNLRLSYLNKPQQGYLQNCHNLDFPDESMDNVVSIGCFHHTGSIEKCINEAYRVLKPGGKLLFMCYNKHSLTMLKDYTFSIFLNPSNPLKLLPKEAFVLDSDTNSEPPPFTEVASMGYYRRICSKFRTTKLSYENSEDLRIRKYILNNLARILGANVYGICKK